jgi:uncharacterized protein YbaR (Trm112 family)
VHILLTDILTCPRCGPGFGLIVLADRIEDRRVLSGGLGCANCRNEYPVRDGIADLRTAPATPGAPPPAPNDPERAFRLAALSGIADRQGTLLVAGAEPDMVEEMARLLPNAQLVGIGSTPPGRTGSVSWVLAGGGLPFRDRSLLAAAILGPPDPAVLTDLARVMLPGGRLVLDGAGAEAAASLGRAEWTLLLDQEGVAVASRTPAG